MNDEYSEEQLGAVFATADEWYEAFAKSPEFTRLNDSHQRKAGAITEFFARHTHEYLGILLQTERLNQPPSPSDVQ